MLWRDFGVHPLAMLRRATIEPMPGGGEPIAGGRPAERRLVDAFAREVEAHVAAYAKDGDLGAFQARFAESAARCGVDVTYRRGAPTVAWSAPGKLDVIDSGGGPAKHEMVHAAQYAIGGIAALSTAAAAGIRREHGRDPRSAGELRAAVARLGEDEKRAAFAAIVEPMESQAYAILEKGAFHATGMLGKRAEDRETYAARFRENVGAYADAYTTATVPKIDAALDARAYASIGHVARTHGETAALCFTGAAGYAELVMLAAAFHPAAAAAALLPAGYLLYRCATG